MSIPARVASGQSVGRLLRASTINYTLEGAELAHRFLTGERSGQRGDSRAGRVQVRNDTGTDLNARFKILGITGIVFDPGDSDEAEAQFQESYALKGDTPDESRDGAGRIAVTQSPVADGKLVSCVMDGLTVAKISLPDSETYTAAVIDTDDHDKFTAAEHGPYVVVWHEEGPGTKWCVINLGACGECEYFWDFEIHGGLPTTGSQIWSVTLNADTQNVTVDYDMTAAELTTHLLAQFSGLASADINVTGGPLPEVPLTVRWKRAFANHASSDWPPTVGTNSLDNAGWMLVRQINPRG